MWPSRSPPDGEISLPVLFRDRAKFQTSPAFLFVTLAAERQPMNERFRQAGVVHATLHPRNIIRYAPKFHDVVLQISDGKSGARIAVARLADGAGVQQILVAGLQV